MNNARCKAPVRVTERPKHSPNNPPPLPPLPIPQHPDDKNEAIFPKILILIGFTIAQGSVLLLPLDVANNEGYAGCDGFDTDACGGLDMNLLWEIIYIAILVYVGE